MKVFENREFLDNYIFWLKFVDKLFFGFFFVILLYYLLLDNEIFGLMYLIKYGDCDFVYLLVEEFGNNLKDWFCV